MDDMRPRQLSTGVKLIILGVIVLAVGLVTWRLIGVDRFIKTEDIELSFDGSQADSLDIEIGYGEFQIRVYDGNEIRFSGKNVPERGYDISMKNGCFSVDNKPAKWYEPENQIYQTGKGPEIVIYIPDKEYSSFRLSGGVGETEISGITSAEADIDTGVGKSRFTGCSFSRAEVAAGVGECSFKECSIGSAEFKCGLGEFKYSGKITEGLTAECGVGECSFSIDGSYGDYDITTDKGIGEINIDKGSSSESSGKNIPISLKCGLGEVNIKFN